MSHTKEYNEATELLDDVDSRLETVENEMRELRYRLTNVEGSLTEVYSRIVGYYRNINNWNPGKKDEYKRRREFDKTDKLPPLNTPIDPAPSWMKPGNNLYDINYKLSEERIM